MLVWTLVLNAILGLLLAPVLLLVGAKLHQRSRLSQRPGLAWFAAFWIGIGAYALVESLWTVVYLAGGTALAVGLFVLHVKIVAISVAFASLVAYLLSIHGRDQRLTAWLMGAYALLWAFTTSFYAWRRPIAQEPGVWGMRLLYAVNDTQPWWTILLLLLLLPPLIASIAYLRLLRYTTEPELRYRIRLTSASLLLFFLPMLLGWRAGGTPWWGAVERLLSGLMTLGVVLALWPPGFMRERWSRPRAVRDDELIARARALI